MVKKTHKPIKKACSLFVNYTHCGILNMEKWKCDINIQQPAIKLPTNGGRTDKM